MTNIKDFIAFFGSPILRRKLSSLAIKLFMDVFQLRITKFLSYCRFYNSHFLTATRDYGVWQENSVAFAKYAVEGLKAREEQPELLLQSEKVSQISLLNIQGKYLRE